MTEPQRTPKKEVVYLSVEEAEKLLASKDAEISALKARGPFADLRDRGGQNDV